MKVIYTGCDIKHNMCKLQTKIKKIKYYLTLQTIMPTEI